MPASLASSVFQVWSGEIRRPTPNAAGYAVPEHRIQSPSISASSWGTVAMAMAWPDVVQVPPPSSVMFGPPQPVSAGWQVLLALQQTQPSTHGQGALIMLR